MAGHVVSPPVGNDHSSDGELGPAKALARVCIAPAAGPGQGAPGWYLLGTRLRVGDLVLDKLDDVVRDAVRLAERVSDPVRDAETLPVAAGEAPPRDGETEEETVRLCEPEALRVTLDERVRLGETLALAEADLEALPLPLRVLEGVALAVAELLKEALIGQSAFTRFTISAGIRSREYRRTLSSPPEK